jgi:hypothetical protein
MALDPHPDILRCANKWRHGGHPLPAVAFIRDAAFCQGCINSLAVVDPAAVRAHVVYIDPARQRRATPDRPVDDLTYDPADNPAWPDPAP